LLCLNSEGNLTFAEKKKFSLNKEQLNNIFVVSSTNKIDPNDITEILLKVALNIITLTL
jgi:hypothetical protein